MSFFTGDPGGYESRLEPGQQPIKEGLYGAAQGRGQGGQGAYGTAADYYYDIMNNDPETFQRLFAPEMRRFREQIIPGLSEQFAGMGAGGLSSSGFRNSLVGAGTDLSERLAGMREDLRMKASQGLQNIGKQSLDDYQYYNPGSPGILETAAPLIGTGIAAATGNPFAGAGAQGLFSSNKGKSSPYGGSSLFSNKQPGPGTSGRYGLPTFGGY